MLRAIVLLSTVWSVPSGIVIEGETVVTVALRVAKERIVSPCAARAVASELIVAEGITPTSSRPTMSAAL